MKYSLKNEYKELLNEEVASVKSKSTGFEEKLYNITFDRNKENISSGTPHNVDPDSQFLVNICQQFTTEPANRIIDFLKIRKISSVSGKRHGITLRKYVGDDDINKICARLNKYFKETIFWEAKSSKRVGRGEVSVNLAYHTLTDGVDGYNSQEHKEPDFVALKKENSTEVVRYSVKSFTKANELSTKPGQSTAGGAQTGTNFSKKVAEVLKKFEKEIFENIPYDNVFSLNFAHVNNKISTTYTPDRFQEAIRYFINQKASKEEKLRLVERTLELVEELKEAIIVEHEAMGIIAIDNSNVFFPILPGEGYKIYITGFSGSRIKFKTNATETNFKTKINELVIEINDGEEFDFAHYKPQGKVLKEIYSHLFKKKLINEGGLAGHMMHPYEALDMTPRQIIDRIKEYSTSQSIIEKVDGQNLFFTVEQDGTLMFARNKEDMTHDDLVTKFTGHPAELPFVEGGNAIKKGVEQWLQSAGDAAEMEIREIFHPAGEIKSFINFEIMHPDKPNQIIYDEKYIVFHSIIDYVDGRKTVHSTNKGQRLEKVLRLMDSGVSAAGFTLASNRTVNLNELTNVQIEYYVERIKEVAQLLEITEAEFLGDGIERQIKKEVDSLGINISDEDLKVLYNFALYGEDRLGNKIKSKDFTSNMEKPDITKLRSIDLTSASKALKKVQRMLSPFKEIFVDLGIDLLKGVKSAYMSEETNQMNIDLLKDKLKTAIDDLIDYMQNTSENYWEAEAHRLRPHLDKVIDKDIDLIVSTAVEGGVYDYQDDLLKVTGGFAPLNQILGAAYRDKKGMFPTFKEKFMKQESKNSLKKVFSSIF